METRDIIYISAEVIVGVISVVGNSIVLAAIIKTQRLHTITNVFVGNLAVADILVGLLVAPCAGLSFLGIPPNFYGCVFINCLILMFTNVSILMLLAVAFERFLAIKEPFLYQRVLTIHRAIYINLLVWALGVVLGLVPMYGWNHGYHEIAICMFTDVITYPYMVYFQFFGLVLVPLFIMLCIYIYILLIVRRHMRQTNALHNLFRQGNQPTQNFNKDVKAAKMFALVIFLFGVFWIPVNLFNCLSLFCPETCTFPYESLLVAIVMSHANSTINPFLYAATNSRILEGIKGLFGIKTRNPDRSSTDQYQAARPSSVKTKTHVRDNSVHPAPDTENNHQTRPFTVSQDLPPLANGKSSPSPQIDRRRSLQDGTNLTITTIDIPTTTTLVNSEDQESMNNRNGKVTVQNGGENIKLEDMDSSHDTEPSDVPHPPSTQPHISPTSSPTAQQPTDLSGQHPITTADNNNDAQTKQITPTSPSDSHLSIGHANPAFVGDESTHNKTDDNHDDVSADDHLANTNSITITSNSNDVTYNSENQISIEPSDDHIGQDIEIRV